MLIFGFTWDMNSKLLGESTALYPSPSPQPPPYIDIVTLNTMSHTVYSFFLYPA